MRAASSVTASCVRDCCLTFLFTFVAPDRDHAFPDRHPLPAIRREKLPLLLRQLAAFQQIRPSFPRAAQRLLETPHAYCLMVPGKQDFRHPRPSVHLGPRVVRAIEQSGGKRVLQRRIRIVQHARAQTQHRVDQHQRRQLAPGNDEIAHGDLLVHLPFEQPLVDPFVTPGDEHQSRRVAFRRQLGNPPMRERLARRRQVKRSRRRVRPSLDCADRAAASAAASGSASITIPGPPP